MSSVELSINELHDGCVEWAKTIENEFSPELIVYIAKAGYPIAAAFNEVFNVELLGIGASRKGNGLKDKIGPIFAHLPGCFRNFLTKAEMKLNVHGKNTERNISFHQKLKDLDVTKYKNILIVDDSVDTGNSVLKAKEEIARMFSPENIAIASLNVWDKSKELIEVEFALYRNTIIKAPMSKDSKEYKIFTRTYMTETENEYI